MRFGGVDRVRTDSIDPGHQDGISLILGVSNEKAKTQRERTDTYPSSGFENKGCICVKRRQQRKKKSLDLDDTETDSN